MKLKTLILCCVKKVISQMLNLHPFFDNIICVAASDEFITELPIFKITSKFLTSIWVKISNNNIFTELKKFSFKENNQDCSICLVSLEYQEEVSYLPCSHLFHSICLRGCLSKVSYFNQVIRTIN